MARRGSLSKRVRFEIFKRDDFTCQYCGKHPPEVVLEVDHIQPVATGGTDEPGNLITACFPCNRGKAAVELSDRAKPLAVKAAEVAEREEQLRGYQEIMEARRHRIEQETWDVIEALQPGVTSFRRDWIQSIKKFLETLGFHEVLEAAEIAKAKKPYSNYTAFRYFCGVCWQKIKRRDGDA